MSKEQLNLRIDEDLLKEFKMGVLEKYGKLYGALAEATEEAMRMWLKGNKRK